MIQDTEDTAKNVITLVTQIVVVNAIANVVVVANHVISHVISHVTSHVISHVANLATNHVADHADLAVILVVHYYYVVPFDVFVNRKLKKTY